MTRNQRDVVLKELFDAFEALEKPVPLTSNLGSHCDEEVDIFNKTDWDNATYLDFVNGLEGSIICPPKTKAYLIPRLLKMVILRLSGVEDGAVDNLSAELQHWPIDASVEKLLSDHQKKAIVAAWEYLDKTVYRASNSDTARKFAKHWNINLQ